MLITKIILFFIGIGLIYWISPVIKAQIKGRRGEKMVRHKLAQEGATAMHDVLLPKGRGDKLAQIDHIVLTQSEIVVIETKDWGGSFTDPGEGKNWVQRMGYKYPRTYYRHSPVVQNKTHHSVVARIIGSPWKLNDLVVMAGDCNFPAGVPDHVILLRDLIPELRKKGLDATKASPHLVSDWNKLKVAQKTSSADRKNQMKQVTRSEIQFYREYYSGAIFGIALLFILAGVFG